MCQQIPIFHVNKQGCTSVWISIWKKPQKSLVSHPTKSVREQI